jgi:hypothetical protein
MFFFFSLLCQKLFVRNSVADPGSEIRDPVLFYPLDPGFGSGMNFLRIPDPRGMFFGEIFLKG